MSDDFEIVKPPEEIFLDIPDDIIFPNELNAFFKQKLLCCLHENGMLKKCLEDYERKIKVLEDQQIDSKKENNVDDAGPLSAAARSKIVDLGRKLREKTAEATAFRNKCVRLEQELVSAKHKDAKDVKPKKEPDEKKVTIESELKTLQEKVANLGNKLFDEKNNNLVLKNEIKQLKLQLREEIGQSLNSPQGEKNWKGRALIIKELQHKIAELKEKLKSLQEKGDNNKDADKTTKSKMENLIKTNELLELKLNQANEKLRKEETKLKNAISECNALRLKISNIEILFEKQRRENTQLMEESTKTINEQKETITSKCTIIDKYKEANKELKTNFKKLECQLENVKKAQEESQQQIQKLKNEEIDAADLEKRCNSFTKISVVNLVKAHEERLIKERSAKEQLEQMYLSEKQKVGRLEMKVGKSQSRNNGSYSSLVQSRTGSECFNNFQLELAEEKIKALETKLLMEKQEREQDLKEFTRILQSFE